MNFLKKFNNIKNIRYLSFEKTLKLCLERNHKNIVETGTSRGKIKFFFFRKHNWKDGMSTVMFAEYAKFVNGKLHTCDISEKNIYNAKKFTKNLTNFINFYVDDSINFLKNFNQKIDLLYLDSFDGHDPVKASEHQLMEAQVSINKLHQASLILLDDKGAKTNLSIDFYKKNGFKIINETKNQILFSRE
tara:strand:+ start:3130 stop:3696 length:567 start_codon:yes stop_codon:yes gene_type:complete